jgi:hypothetical protein
MCPCNAANSLGFSAAPTANNAALKIFIATQTKQITLCAVQIQANNQGIQLFLVCHTYMIFRFVFYIYTKK